MNIYSAGQRIIHSIDVINLIFFLSRSKLSFHISNTLDCVMYKYILLLDIKVTFISIINKNFFDAMVDVMAVMVLKK